MASPIFPGRDGTDPLQRRVAAIERLLTGLDVRRVKVKDQHGKLRYYGVLSNRGAPADDDQVLPPFWPILITKTSGGVETYFVTVTDGYIEDHKGGNANADAFESYYPTGMAVSPGEERIEIPILAGQQIAVVVDTDKNGGPTTSTVMPGVEDEPSLNPDPLATSGGYGRYVYPLAILRPKTETDPAYLEYRMAGSHIPLRVRGHNLDLHVFNVDICDGAISELSNYFLCWRNGDYVGKFLTTPPAFIGSCDAESVTYIAGAS